MRRLTRTAACLVCLQRDRDLVTVAHLRTTLTARPLVNIFTSLLPLKLAAGTDSAICLKCSELLDQIDALGLQLKLKTDELRTLYYNGRSSSICNRPKMTKRGARLGKKETVARELCACLSKVHCKCSNTRRSRDGETQGSLALMLSSDGSSTGSSVPAGQASENMIAAVPVSRRNTAQLLHANNSIVDVGADKKAINEGSPVVIVAEANEPSRQSVDCDALVLAENRAADVEEDTLAESSRFAFPCPDCGLELIGSESSLASHLRKVHHTVRPWRCGDCAKTFGKRLDRDNHRRVHSGDRPFQCEDCGARFSQGQNLRTHIRTTHQGERRHACSLCSKRFARRRLLDCHVNAKHAGRRPFGCNLCAATFIYPEHVRKHQAAHLLAANEAEKSRKEARFSRTKGDQKSAAAEARMQLFSCHQCTKNCLSQTELSAHKCAEETAGCQYEVPGGAGGLVHHAGVGELSKGPPPTFAGDGSMGQRVIICLQDGKGTSQLCYSTLLGDFQVQESVSVELASTQEEAEVKRAVLSIAEADSIAVLEMN